MEAQHMDMSVLADKQELIYIGSVQSQDVVWRTCQKWWMVGMDGEKESKKFVLSAWLDEEKKLLMIYYRNVLLNILL